MIAIWEIGSILHVFFLFGSLTRPKIFKKVPKPSKIPSLLSAQAGIYTIAIIFRNAPNIKYPSLIPGPYPERLTRNKCHRMEALYGVVPYKPSITLPLTPTKGRRRSDLRQVGVHICMLCVPIACHDRAGGGDGGGDARGVGCT